MATWLVLIEAGNKNEPIAVNLDRAVSIKRLADKTRIEFEENRSIDVIEPVSAILDLAKEAARAHRS